MDPRQLFVDERLAGNCIHCGGVPTTRDHVPSKVFLDRPYPDDLPVTPACDQCNNGFSLDEAYLACLVECMIAGSADPNAVDRASVRRTLTRAPALAARIAESRLEDESGNVSWRPDEARVRNVILKLARGHAVFECGEPQLDEPEAIDFAPLCTLTAGQRQAFETPAVEHVFPEIGSRALLRAVVAGTDVVLDEGWQVVQPGRYRYLVSYSDRMAVRVVFSEYLACEVGW